jgi:uncharacterized protein YegL
MSTPNTVETDMHELTTASNYSFSAVGLDSLGASEYTLATVVVDVSVSVSNWRSELVKCIETIKESCEHSPRSENLLLRVVKFDDNVDEVHGFKILDTIDSKDYDKEITIGGCTALYDALHSSIESTSDYSKVLVNNGDMSANAVVYVITDGVDNASVGNPKKIKKLMDTIMQDEVLESCAVILIGIGQADYFTKLTKEANITQFIDIGDLFAKTSPAAAMAKLAGYISKSIVSTSQSLSNGTSNSASSLLTF